MNLNEIITNLNLKVLTETKDFAAIQPSGGYCADLLSCVMAGAKTGNLWVTLQSHINIVAVAALTDCAAIIITEDANPEPEVIEKANAQGVTLLATPQDNYRIVAQLSALGIH